MNLKIAFLKILDILLTVPLNMFYMSFQIYTDYVASISDLKKNPMLTVQSAHGEPVAILNRNQPVFYCIPADVYENMLNFLENQELINLIETRAHEKEIPVNINDL